MITVHHLENSRSQRVLWLLEELEIPYEIQHYKRDRKTNLAPPELKSVHPVGKSPVITDGDVTVAETGAIIEYVLERHGKGRLVPPAGTPERLRYTYWLHAAEGSIMPLLVMKLIFTQTTRKPVPFFIRPITKAVANEVGKAYIDPSLKAMLDYAESELSRSEWFAGDEFSAADVQMSFPVEGAAVRADLSEDYPRMQAFLDRIHARPAWKKALERGGPYDLLS